MKRRLKIWIFAGFGLVLAAWSYNLYFKVAPAGYMNIPEVFKESAGPPGRQMQIFVVKERGYSGEIEFAVTVDNAGKIARADIINHSETPAYVNERSLEKFLASFAGKNIREVESWQAFNRINGKQSRRKAGQGLDAISGASVTTAAIIRGIKKASLMAGAEAPAAGPAPVEQTVILTDVIVFLIFIAVSVWGFFYTGKYAGAYRISVLLFAVVYIGFYRDLTFSIVNVLNFMTLRFPPLSGGTVYYMFFAMVAAATLFFGRFYCGWICPHGALQEFIGSIARWRSTSSPAGRRGARRGGFPETGGAELSWRARFKYILLFAAVILALISDKPNLANYEPFITTFKVRGGAFAAGLAGAGAIIALTYAVIALGASFFANRFFCKYVCPAGALLGICSYLTIYKLKIERSCPGCNKCKEVCPVGAIEPVNGMPDKINIAECIQCNECIRACPDSIIRRKFK